MFRIAYQRGKCIGCNACVEAAPDQWRVSKKDGRCNLIGGRESKGMFHAQIGDEEAAQNLKAAANCPVKIIRVEAV